MLAEAGVSAADIEALKASGALIEPARLRTALRFRRQAPPRQILERRADRLEEGDDGARHPAARPVCWPRASSNRSAITSSSSIVPLAHRLDDVAALLQRAGTGIDIDTRPPHGLVVAFAHLRACRRRPGRHAGPRAASRLRPAAPSRASHRRRCRPRRTAASRSPTARTVIGRPSAAGSDADKSCRQGLGVRPACGPRSPPRGSAAPWRARGSVAAPARRCRSSAGARRRRATGSARRGPTRRRCAAWSASCRRAAPGSAPVLPSSSRYWP